MPFILEPFFANYLPLHIAKLIVRSNADFQGHRAEQVLDRVSLFAVDRVLCKGPLPKVSLPKVSPLTS